MEVKTSVALSVYDSSRMTEQEMIANAKPLLMERLIKELEKYVKFGTYFSPEEHRSVISAKIKINDKNNK